MKRRKAWNKGLKHTRLGRAKRQITYLMNKGIGWREARERTERDFGILFPENILKD